MSWLWTSHFFVNKWFLFTTYNKSESIYWEWKGKISTFKQFPTWIHFPWITILIYSFYILNILIPLGCYHKQLCRRISKIVHKKTVESLNLSLTTFLLQLLLHNMWSSVGKLMCQCDYPKLECHQSINTENLYMEH